MNIKYVEHSWEGRRQSIQSLNWNRGGLTRLFGDFNASHWCKWNTLWNIIICCNFLWKLHDCTRVLFINFGGKFCNIRLNFSTWKIFTKVRHDMKTVASKRRCIHQTNKTLNWIGNNVAFWTLVTINTDDLLFVLESIWFLMGWNVTMFSTSEHHKIYYKIHVWRIDWAGFRQHCTSARSFHFQWQEQELAWRWRNYLVNPNH